MADTVDPEKVANDTKTASLNQDPKSGDEMPQIQNNADDALRMLESAAVVADSTHRRANDFSVESTFTSYRWLAREPFPLARFLY